MRIYILRHGQTDMNKAKCVQGRMNTQLNERGIAQAEELAEVIREQGLTFDLVYSSPLERAAHTCEIATGLDRADIIIDERLAEFDFGELEGCEYRSLPDEAQYFFTAPEKFQPKGRGETFEQLIGRTKDFFEELKNVRAESVLISSHGAAIHAMLLLFRGKELKDFWDEDVFNCDLTMVELTNGAYQVLPEKIEVDHHKTGFI